MIHLEKSPLRIAFLWSHLSGYLNACLKELSSDPQVQLFVSYQTPSADAPFQAEQFQWLRHAIPWQQYPEKEPLKTDLQNFQPHILVFGGWHYPTYREIARSSHGKCLRIMAFDNCWNGTFRQHLGARVASSGIRKLADRIWIPGERQAVFARKFGFPERKIMRGLYACDINAFNSVFHARVAEQKALPRAFIFVGRFVEKKGIRTLLDAYTHYRAHSPNPWPLVCCGAGPMHNRINATEGVQMFGFCDTQQLAQAFSRTGCLILPSQFEPWAVVVHEAASAGLAILASQKVGAAVHLVQPGLNGHIFEDKDTHALSILMTQLSTQTDARLEEMSRASVALAQQFSPGLWVRTLLDAHSEWTQSAASTST